MFSSMQLNAAQCSSMQPITSRRKFRPLQVIEYAYALDTVNSTMALEQFLQLNIQLNAA